MMQGDSYGILVEITKEDGTLVTGSDVSEVEITIGPYTKTMTSGAVVYDDVDGSFIFPVSEEETFRLKPHPVNAQIRIMWTDGSIEGVPLGKIRVSESMSKGVLSHD